MTDATLPTGSKLPQLVERPEFENTDIGQAETGA